MDQPPGSGTPWGNPCKTDADCSFAPSYFQCNSTKHCEPKDIAFDLFSNHPWRHPGKAPVWSGCGIAGGNPAGCVNPDGSPITHIKDRLGGCAPGGFDHGPDASSLWFP